MVRLDRRGPAWVAVVAPAWPVDVADPSRGLLPFLWEELFKIRYSTRRCFMLPRTQGSSGGETTTLVSRKTRVVWDTPPPVLSTLRRTYRPTGSFMVKCCKKFYFFTFPPISSQSRSRRSLELSLLGEDESVSVVFCVATLLLFVLFCCGMCVGFQHSVFFDQAVSALSPRWLISSLLWFTCPGQTTIVYIGTYWIVAELHVYP